MNPKRKQRLIIVSFLVIGVSATVGLIMAALSSNVNHFYNPTEVAQGAAPVDKSIRVGGMVVDGSVSRDGQSLAVAFTVTDYNSNVDVKYTGILPDLFREGQGIVATGKLDAQGVFQAEEVLAKHDEKYMPPEVQRALDKAQDAAPAQTY
ncbi:Cytochrome c-type biogenesis protein CcmE [Hahella chejuensis KCTC 2396]|uniref:Cytochrome c-type biogenesis protein CcmE n=1 Tax=Hahella chejuensis (strain KCTC 2396) TaxID=349521 RepID=CCME_HAHCH|nr:cytochrome c maturation protein CcmE [Hahella chejuensis]Q2SE53.1 RecName: Full=Cytochrome c-type biogenesis protein CcmE; AltName: Full=Cytochrome c maturation protein E; AltName: Full=Heme chaperone CcmE [Hahella chejuensis KCTC 2396]ABC31071.1 Cytochrome c-type biogenesis protein CcmE [Hahella chejuensis KCTC 2396]